MYRLTDIEEGLKHLVGWEQSFNPAEAIEEDLTESESGLRFQNAHPLLTLENIRSIIPENFYFQYPLWDNSADYHKGDKVRHSNKVWIALQDNVAETPAEGSIYWKQYDFLSDYLRRLTKNGIDTTIQTFMQMKGLHRESKSLLERRTFFDGSGRINAIIENRGRLVGFEIIPVRAMGVTTKIERIGLQMKGGTGIVKMYLFHSSQRDPIKTFDLDFTNTNGGFQWFDIKDTFMPYISQSNNSGGSWYLVYNQDDLPAGMEAINMSKDWSREPCGTCNPGNLENWREITKYLYISPFSIKAPSTFAQYPEFWDIDMMSFTNTINYGLNVEVSVGCDLTDFILQQKMLFATALQRQVATIALRTMALNPDVRVNRNQSNVNRNDILYEIDGNTQGRPSGLGYELKMAYEALSLDTRGIDRICLSCHNGGVKYTTA